VDDDENWIDSVANIQAHSAQQLFDDMTDCSVLRNFRHFLYTCVIHISDILIYSNEHNDQKWEPDYKTMYPLLAWMSLDNFKDLQSNPIQLDSYSYHLSMHYESPFTASCVHRQNKQIEKTLCTQIPQPLTIALHMHIEDVMRQHDA